MESGMDPKKMFNWDQVFIEMIDWFI
jgi:hypothetical protein